MNIMCYECIGGEVQSFLQQYGETLDQDIPDIHTVSTLTSDVEASEGTEGEVNEVKIKRRTGRTSVWGSKLPPKLSEVTSGSTYEYDRDPLVVLSACPHMLVPFIAAAELRNKDKQGESA